VAEHLLRHGARGAASLLYYPPLTPSRAFYPSRCSCPDFYKYFYAAFCLPRLVIHMHCRRARRQLLAHEPLERCPPPVITHACHTYLPPSRATCHRTTPLPLPHHHHLPTLPATRTATCTRPTTGHAHLLPHSARTSLPFKRDAGGGLGSGRLPGSRRKGLYSPLLSTAAFPGYRYSATGRAEQTPLRLRAGQHLTNYLVLSAFLSRWFAGDS